MHPATRRIAAARCVFLAACLALLATLALPGAARAQIPSGPPPSCKQLWEEASEQAARAAEEKARAAGAPSGWIQTWAQAWKASWSASAAGLKPARDGNCCDINWFELGAQAGKAAWQRAWQAAGNPGAERYARAYADAWAQEWFLHYPWLCAKASVNVVANAFADAAVWTDAAAWAWAFASASVDAYADAQASSFKSEWGYAGATAWAEAGAIALANATASGYSGSSKLIEGNCATVKAAACAKAAADSFAESWADAGAHAFADAHAMAWADAFAYAYASAWAHAFAQADARAFATAFAQAWSNALAQAFAAAWRQRLADQGQIPALVRWWAGGGAMPPLKTIWQLLAKAYATDVQTAFKVAMRAAVSNRSDWDQAIRQAQKSAVDYTTTTASAWVSKWAAKYASDYAIDWADAAKKFCAKEAATVCAECKPCTTTTTGTTGSRPKTVSRPKDVHYKLGGLGVTSGTVFQIAVENTTSEPMEVEVPAGSVLVPSDPSSQRVMIAEDQHLSVPANQTAQAPLQGYCLDYGKQAPPATQLGALATAPVLVAALAPETALAALLAQPPAAVTYAFDNNPTAYAPFLRIIQAGNRLAAEGKLHTDLPPDKQKLAVIQRAIWTYSSHSSPKPHTRDTLLADIRKQVKDSGGTQSDEQIQELVNHLMEDVEAVLRTAGVS